MNAILALAGAFLIVIAILLGIGSVLAMAGAKTSIEPTLTNRVLRICLMASLLSVLAAFLAGLALG
jgi:hypothetical protein